jgi:hypothetical protein
MQIHVNGDPIEVADTVLSYERVAAFAGYTTASRPTITWATVGIRPQIQDVLKPGEAVVLLEAIHFNVSRPH